MPPVAITFEGKEASIVDISLRLVRCSKNNFCQDVYTYRATYGVDCNGVKQNIKGPLCDAMVFTTPYPRTMVAWSGGNSKVKPKSWADLYYSVKRHIENELKSR